MNNSGYNIKK